MKVKQITIYTTSEASELVADILFDIGCEGVSIYDSADFATLLSSDVIWDYVDENALKRDPVVRVVGCVDENASLAPLHELLDNLKRNCPFETGSLEISCNIVEADAWADEWKKYYSPQHYGKLTVVPEWIDYKAAPGEVVVKMDPGMAFGTGEHESTRICLTLLEKTVKGGESVIDVGCGSGILAAAALKLGAGCADACDIDPIAVKAAGENAARNGVNVRVVQGSIGECARGKYDIILANITADVLISMSKDFKEHVKGGGALIMSGVINARSSQVEQAVSDAGFTLAEKIVDGEWTGYLWR